MFGGSFKSQTSDLWTDAATVVKAVTEEEKIRRERTVEIEDEGARKGPGQASGLRGEKLHAVVAQSRF